MEDEIENLEEDLQLAGNGSHYAPAPGAAGAAGGPAGGGLAPWELVRSAAANLPLSHLGREKAGNAEITPLQVGPGADRWAWAGGAGPGGLEAQGVGPLLRTGVASSARWQPPDGYTGFPAPLTLCPAGGPLCHV